MVRTYDPGQVVVTWGGLIFDGFMSGTFVTVSRTAKSFEKFTGANGEVTRVRKRDRSGTVKISLLQTAIGNAALSAYLALDEEGADQVKPLSVKDLSGASLYEAPQAWISGPPEAAFSEGEEGREWEFDCGKLRMTSGGN